MDPKLMLIAVYQGTKTLQNLQSNLGQSVVLQLLSQELAPVVRVCGQQSGNQINKITRLQKRYDLTYRADLPYFSTAAGVLELESLSLTPCAGDHQLLVGRVSWSKNLHDTPILTTDYLKEHAVIR